MKQYPIRKNIAFLVLTIFIFELSKLIIMSNFSHLYLCEWTYRNNYLYIPFIALVLILLNKYIISFSITAGNIIGIFIGQIAGDTILAFNIQKIGPATTVQESHQLQTHYGVLLWLLTVLLFVIVSTIITIYSARN